MKRREIHARSAWLLALLSSAALGSLAAAQRPQRPLELIPGQYIVRLREDAGEPGARAAALARSHGLKIGHVYGSALRGFSCRATEAAAGALARRPEVAGVMPDLRVRASGQTFPTGVRRARATHITSPVMVDGQGDTPDIDIAVIDTGVGPHSDLRIAGGVDFTGSGSYQDGNGHGTHVAGIAAALDNSSGVVGACPGARVWAVRVLGADGSGMMSDVIAGIDWVADGSKHPPIEVANLSLGAYYPLSSREQYGDPLEESVKRANAAGVHLVAAAGNDALDAVDFIPARYDEVLCVSALDDRDGIPSADDRLAAFSNHGTVVDTAAPGVSIYSTLPNEGFYALSGTSMAAPHAAGAVADYLLNHPSASPAAVREAFRVAGESAPAGGWPGDPDGTPEQNLDLPVLLNQAERAWPAPAPDHTVNLLMPATIRRGFSIDIRILAMDNLGQPVVGAVKCRLVDSRGRDRAAWGGFNTDVDGLARLVYFTEKNEPTGPWTLTAEVTTDGRMRSRARILQVGR